MTQFGTETIDRIRAREILLGNRFAPRKKDIDTPPLLLLEGGFPPDVLRLVSVSADEGMKIKHASKDEPTGTLYSALCVVQTLRWRSDDEPVFAVTDVPTLCKQDIGLLNTLAAIVHPFLLGRSAQAVADAKNGSAAASKADGQKNDGGTASPDTSDLQPHEPVNEQSTTPTS